MLPAVVLRGLLVLMLLAASPFATASPALDGVASWEAAAPDAVELGPQASGVLASGVAPSPPRHVPRTLDVSVPPQAAVDDPPPRVPPPPAWRRVARLRSDGTADP